MNAYAAGLDSLSRRSRTAGVPDPSTPVTNQWRSNMEAAIGRVRAKYPAGATSTVAELLPDVDKAYSMAGQFAEQAPTVKIGEARIKQARANSLALLEVRAALRIRPPGDVVGPDELSRAVAAMTAPVQWLIDVGAPIVADAEGDDWGKRLKTFLWIAGGLAALWIAKSFLDSGIQAKRELVGERPLFAPRAMVKNPPAWAADPIIWEQARVAVEPFRSEYENPDAVTVHVYKQLGGRVS